MHQITRNILNIDLSEDPIVKILGDGAIAIGHLSGASGARIMTSLVHQMKENKNLKNGLKLLRLNVYWRWSRNFSVSVEN